MVIRHKPASFPDEQSKMRYAFNCLRGVALGQILPHVREDGTIGLEDLPAFIQLLEAAFGDPDRIATAERKMREIKQKNSEFSQYYAEFQVIAADLDWNPSALRNALRIGLSGEMKDSFTYSDMPEELPAFVTVCQKRDNQIRQRRAEKAAQNTGSGIGFASPQASSDSENPGNGSCWNGRRIYQTSANGSQCRQKKDFGRGKSKEVRGWEVFVLWWV